MDTADIKKYLFIVGTLSMIVFVMFMESSRKKFSCDDWANRFRNNFQCNLVLTDKDNGAGVTTLIGIDPKTKKIQKSEDDSKWIKEHLDTFQMGDTIVKKKGEYTILIKRHNKKIPIYLSCDGKVYKD